MYYALVLIGYTLSYWLVMLQRCTLVVNRIFYLKRYESKGPWKKWARLNPRSISIRDRRAARSVRTWVVKARWLPAGRCCPNWTQNSRLSTRTNRCPDLCIGKSRKIQYKFKSCVIQMPQMIFRTIYRKLESMWETVK